MALPDHITFTGIDEWTDLDRALVLSNRYPIEWGVLFSPQRQGIEPRYPSLAAVERIIAHTPGTMATTAAHLCGEYARAVVAGRPPDIAQLLMGAFDRYQVNTVDPKVNPWIIADVARSLGGIPILQCRTIFPKEHCDVEWLFDASGGRGLSPATWPIPPQSKRTTVGYAGGLGPETITAALAEIGPRHDAAGPYWIDMESAVRTDDRLDLDKCEAVCRAVYGEVGALATATPAIPA